MALTKQDKSKLAKALRKAGLRITAGGTPAEWERAKSLLASGKTPAQVAKAMAAPVTTTRKVETRLHGAALAAKQGRVVRDDAGRIVALV